MGCTIVFPLSAALVSTEEHPPCSPELGPAAVPLDLTVHQGGKAVDRWGLLVVETVMWELVVHPVHDPVQFLGIQFVVVVVLDWSAEARVV